MFKVDQTINRRLAHIAVERGPDRGREEGELLLLESGNALQRIDEMDLQILVLLLLEEPRETFYRFTTDDLAEAVDDIHPVVLGYRGEVVPFERGDFRDGLGIGRCGRDADDGGRWSGWSHKDGQHHHV